MVMQVCMSSRMQDVGNSTIKLARDKDREWRD